MRGDRAGQAGDLGPGLVEPFADDADMRTENTVYVYADEATAQEAFDGLTSGRTRQCIGEQLGKRMAAEAGLEVGRVRTTRLAIDPLGDQFDAARLIFPVSSQDVDVDLIVDVVYVRVGRAANLLLFLNSNSPFDEQLRAGLTAATVRRLSGALDA